MSEIEEENVISDAFNWSNEDNWLDPFRCLHIHRVQSINEISNNRRSEMNKHLIRKSPRLRPQILPMPTRKKKKK